MPAVYISLVDDEEYDDLCGYVILSLEALSSLKKEEEDAK